MIDINQDIRSVAAIFVVAGSASAFLAGDQLRPEDLPSEQAGVLVVSAAALTQTLGRAAWARAALTLAGTAAATAVIAGHVPETPSAFYFGSVFWLGTAAALLQYTRSEPFAPLSALATAAPIAAVMDQIGILLILLGVASCTGVIFESFQHLWGGDHPARQNLDVDEEPTMQPAPDNKPEYGTATYPPAPHPPSHPASDGNGQAPYITIGMQPKLLRSTDVSPPRVEFSAPAGHQFDGFAQQGLTIRCASHVGTAHMQQRRIRQDAYAVSATNDGQFVFAAVADGVGSEPNSSLGAEWAASSAVGVGIDSYDNHGRLLSAPEMVRFAADEVRRRARAFGRGAVDTDFSTTLVVAVIGSGGETSCQLARVGDSTAFTRSTHEWLPVFAEHSTSPDAPTNAIPADEPEVEVQETEMIPGQCVLLVSDGVGDLIVHAPDVRSQLFEALASPVSPLEFSAITGFQRRQAHDDQTALCVWRDQATDRNDALPEVAEEEVGGRAGRTA